MSILILALGLLLLVCLCNMFPSNVKSVETIAKYRRQLKTHFQTCLSALAPWRINQSDDNWNCLLTLGSINHFVLMRL